MNKSYIFILLFLTSFAALSQEPGKDIAAARSSYKDGKLEDAHFTLQQTLHQLDIVIGKEVMKVLPAQLEGLNAVTTEDNVSANMGFVGATIHRKYSGGNKTAELNIINNSPLVTTLNAFLTSPLLAGFGSDGKSKVIKLQGYKARLTREEGGEDGVNAHRIEMPFSNALFTFYVTNSSEAEITSMANALPLDKIAKLIQ